MEMIISSVETAKECEFNIKFDPTLVRGQSYYTGTIFEVTMDDFGGSVAGGGRYDKMIGKFTGQPEIVRIIQTRAGSPFIRPTSFRLFTDFHSFYIGCIGEVYIQTS